VYFKIDVDTPELQDGKYWAKLDVSESVQLVSKFVEKPETNKDSIVFKGKVEKGLFKNDTFGRIKTTVEDGSYWAKFKILNVKFEVPEKDKQPQVKRNQVLLFGNVHNGEFKCFIYQCETNLLDGKYWIVLDLKPNDIEFIRAENPKPTILDNQLLITATINEAGSLVADVDKEYQIQTNKKSGKYYAVLEILSEIPDFYKIGNEPPKVEKGQNIVEGNIWVDKYTGEIKFDPKKNRDDHRHHAIDAIAIALTEQGYLQRLSTYNAQRKQKQRHKLDSTEKFPEPWVGFNEDVKIAATQILISHNKNSKTLTKNKKGFSVRGQLHKENVFGKRQAPNQEGGYHRRNKITELKNNKHVGKVVDVAIRNLIEKHLENGFNIDIRNPKGYSIPKDAFYKDGEWQLFLPNKRGDSVPIKKVRMKEAFGNALQLKTNLNQYVNPRNNHHVLIYEDFDGNLKEDVVQFWTVVERKLQNESIYQLPEDGKLMVTALEINDNYLLGLSDKEYESNKNNPAFLSKYIFRVQKISGGDYSFRYHLASTIQNSYEEIRIQSINAWVKQNPIKVKIDMLGNIL
jgi:CRISPR-associated endonuclease Csn1